ncbi:hypothetical protein MFFC18_08570 [Mariniblastus fucicola]|uniref:DNA phosphorothioation-associated methyltransferase n=2 Tax=Mariniblastus fucicola TaxID=980251 RepID=A0A5B9P752_9BACT|nr:hypothetical protein MFFC18_08570 [Mariniblastus fucicola]
MSIHFFKCNFVKSKLPTRSSRYRIGKEIGGAIYLHRDYEDELGEAIVQAKLHLNDEVDYTIVKLNLKTKAISFICCDDFDIEDEPEVGDSIIVHPDGQTRRRSKAKDPEIYHHKWMFVADDYKGFDVERSRMRSLRWINLKGLNKRKIGKKSYWVENVLPRLNGQPRDEVSEPRESWGEQLSECDKAAKPMTEVPRHKTAIKRGSYSKPVKCLLRDGLLSDSKVFFDYGCGHGRDLDLLADIDISCQGWDPAFRPTAPKNEAAVVNIGYVINVIEDPNERADAVRSAWALAKEVLCVAAQIEFAAPEKEQQVFGDGYLTSRGTFQKYYNQHELREYLQDVVGTDAISAAPGIFYLFKCEEAKQQFFATRFKRRYTVPRQRISEVLFDQNRDLLDPFMERLTELGRVPAASEYAASNAIIEKFGSLKRAFKLIQKVTDESPWEEIAQKRCEDLLVYLALARFRKRPPLSKLPPTVQKDIKVFLGGYKVACGRADTLLFRAGDPDAIDQACQRSNVGQLVDNALIFHKSCLDSLEPLLRIYEGCARALVGELDDANVIKLHRFSGKVSYITYDGFDKNPHPQLKERMKVSLRSLNIDWFDYSTWDDPYVLLEKFELVNDNYKQRILFERFAKSLRRIGIVSNNNQLKKSELSIRLKNSQVHLQGHRLVNS